MAARRKAPGSDSACVLDRVTLLCRERSKRRSELEQALELWRVITTSVRTGDEHLPALIEQGVGLGDRHSDTQADRGGDIFAPGRID